ncbi:FAD-binding oxidoreductase [Streptomyces sp. B6B3]|uniref:NAD(P)/FAD-dependent oxidoreductase n=1 Tax=Streptomyces sp. B6B3 TaxID=3153570 RepID=UPI00325E7957
MRVADVVVVGGGIVGASVAYHLAREGVAVTLVDRGAAPAAGATGASFAWIGGDSGDWPGGAADLRGFVLADHRRLAAEVSGAEVRWTGSLAWTDTSVRLRPGAPVGEGQHVVGRREIGELEPLLRTPPERAVYTPTDGGVDPHRTTEALVDAARARGARVVYGSAVTGLRTAGGRVTGVVTATGHHPAATVVLAAGADVNGLCESAGARLPIAASPALGLRVAAPPGLVRTILATPEFEAREARDGHLLMTAVHRDGNTEAELRAHARHAVARLREAFRDVGPVRLLGHRLGRRPMPDGGPLVGRVARAGGVYVAVMHSGVTLAPTVGRLVAEELTTGEPAPELARCRP